MSTPLFFIPLPQGRRGKGEGILYNEYMNILILGGTKFFGREFALHCFRAGHGVDVFSRRDGGLPRGIKFVRGDRADLSSLKGRKWDFVLDNICYSAADMRQAIKTFEGNVKHYVFVSSGDVHLAVRGALSPFAEDLAHCLPRRRGRVDAYGKGKFEAETLLMASGLPYTIVRFPIVVGPRDPKERLFNYLLRVWDGKPIILPDGGHSKRRFISVGDTVRALDLVRRGRNKCLGKVFHFGGEVLSLRRFILMCGPRVSTVDIPLARLNARGYDVGKANPYFNDGDYVLGLSRARRILGWRPTPAKIWLRGSIRFYKDAADSLPVPAGYKDWRGREMRFLREIGE